MPGLTNQEIRLLRDMNGEYIGLRWASWISEVAKDLHGKGLVTGPPSYQINDKGRAALSKIKTLPDPHIDDG